MYLLSEAHSHVLHPLRSSFHVSQGRSQVSRVQLAPHGQGDVIQRIGQSLGVFTGGATKEIRQQI